MSGNKCDKSSIDSTHAYDLRCRKVLESKRIQINVSQVRPTGPARQAGNVYTHLRRTPGGALRFWTKVPNYPPVRFDRFLYPTASVSERVGVRVCQMISTKVRFGEVRKVRRFREVESEHLRAGEFLPRDLTSHHVCDGVNGFFLVVMSKSNQYLADGRTTNWTVRHQAKNGHRHSRWEEKQIFLWILICHTHRNLL
jgi:hypothetical protein